MMLDIINMVNQWVQDEREVALATVVKTWGSAPRREGSKLGITRDMSMIGSVSGGCVEGAVVEEAVAGLKDGKPRLLQFGVSDDTAWDVGLTCGGSIEVWVEPLNLTWWRIASDMAQHDAYAVTITCLDGEHVGEKVLLDGQYRVLFQTDGIDSVQLDMIASVARSATKTGIVTMNDTRLMVDIQSARPHLIVVGGVHVAMPLQQMARLLGFRVSIVDPRSAFASDERFPDVANILTTYPDKALLELGLDRNTYLAVLTHDPKIDDKALTTALPANIPYIGVLSSSRTHAKRVARLKDAGMTDEQIAQIRTPIGINIGSSNPEEIALCIMAEIIAVRNGVRDEVR
jgi:xanthine dehydrogenase accessory factor